MSLDDSDPVNRLIYPSDNIAPYPTGLTVVPAASSTESAVSHTTIPPVGIRARGEYHEAAQDVRIGLEAVEGERTEINARSEINALREKDGNPDIAEKKAELRAAGDGNDRASPQIMSEKAALAMPMRRGGSGLSSDGEESLESLAVGKEKHDEKSSDPVKSTSSSPPISTFVSKLFFRSKANKAKRQAIAQAAAAAEAKSPTPKPISLLALFTYSSSFEKFINLIGLIFAAGAGAAQPLMTLIFGNLTTTLTNFAAVVANSGASPGDAGLLKEFEAAKAELKRSAATDSLDLVWIGLAIMVSTYIYMITWQYTSEVTAKRIRERYLAATLRQDIAYFDDLGPGEVATRIQTDTLLVASGISEKMPLAVSYIATFLTGFILAYIRQPKLAGVLTVMLPVVIVAGGIMSKVIGKYSQRALKHVAEGGSRAEEAMYSIRTAHAFGLQSVLGALYEDHVNKSVKAGTQAAKFQSIGLALMFTIVNAMYALAFAWGGTLIARGEATSGAVITCFMSILIGSFSIGMLAPQLQAISRARGAAAKIYETIERVPLIDSSSAKGVKIADVTGNITFEDVKFHYPSRPDVPVLAGFSGTFRQGQKIALVGASGSGKSTVVALIERFYDPIFGSIKFDGHDLKDLNVKWLRQQVKLVQQEPVLFAMSVKDNIASGLLGTRYENVSAEEKHKLVIDAAKIANAHDFILKLPEGYDTACGAGGMLLSGGQKQRIAIARAVASRPLILLCDEASAALDSQSEQLVQTALDKASEGRLCISIAHRLSTVKGFDIIMVMGPSDDGGVILEQGNHQELMKRGGTYASLVNAQQLAQSQQSQTNSIPPDNGDAAAIAALKLKRTTSAATSSSDTVISPSLSHKITAGSIAKDFAAMRKVEEGEFQERALGLSYIFKRCYLINRDKNGFYVAGFIASCLAGCLTPAISIVYGYAIKNFTIQDRAQLLFESDRSALWYFIIAILCFFITWTQQFSLITTAETLTGKLRSRTFQAILRQDVAFFDEPGHSTGSLTGNLSDQPQKVNGLAGVTLGAILQAMATVVAGCIVGLIYSWKLSLIGIACIPVLISAGYVRLQVVVLKDKKNKNAQADASNLASEAAGAIKTVASLTMELDRCSVYSEALRIPMQRNNKSAYASTFLFALSQCLSFFVIALVFYVGAGWLADGTIALNSFFTVLQSVIFAAIQVGNVFSFVPDASKAKSAASAMIKLGDAIPAIDAQSSEGRLIDSKTLHGNIRLENVHFKYPTRPHHPVLRGLDLDIKAGEYVALVGPSGCGKSTTIGLLERFYDPLVGRVLLDGIPITDLNVASYRSQIALVGQEPTLYAGSIRFNVLLGANKPTDKVTEQELIQACQDANIYDFIMSLPDGLETFVGMRGSTQLSGGQKQRLCIARSLIRNPKILLLDEATSALDSVSERVITKVLNNVAKGRTTIAIAHRLASIAHCDRIFYFKDGAIAEAGTHQELIDRRGGYYELTQLQSLSQV